MARKRKLKDLQIELDLFSLIFGFTPFRWARLAFKTETQFCSEGRTTQLFAGPLHIWTLPRKDELVIRLSVSLNGCTHGTFTPTGDDAIPYFWRWITGRQGGCA